MLISCFRKTNRINSNKTDKKFFLPLFLLFSSVFCTSMTYAQNNCSVKGMVKSHELPVEFATISLFKMNDSLKVVHTTLSDNYGKFMLLNLSSENYIMRIQMLGYETHRIEISLTNETPFIDFKTIFLKIRNNQLNEINISAIKNTMVKTPEGFTVIANEYTAQSGGTVGDLLRNMPSIVVDDRGEITIRGKSPLILINGRNSGLNETDRISASSIESIEIIHNPNAKYDADADGGIINIKLKKNIQYGLNCDLAMGGGVGNKGRLNGATMINYKNNKYNIGLTYDDRYSQRERTRQVTRIDYNLPEVHNLNQQRFDYVLENNQNLKLYLDFALGKNNFVSIEALANKENEENNENLYSTLFKPSRNFKNKNSRNSKQIILGETGEFALNYQHKFAESKKSLSINFSSSFNSGKENTTINTQSLNEVNIPIANPLIQKTSNFYNNNITNLRFDFEQPIFKSRQLGIGYKGIARQTDVDYKILNLSNSEFVINKNASDFFNFKEQIHAAYMMLGGVIGKEDTVKWKYDIGLRCEYVFNLGKGITNNFSSKHDYLNFFPSVNISHFFKSGDNIKLSFSRRINRPTLSDLNPFIDITDSLNQRGGNPFLKPELINSIELGNNKVWKKYSLSSTLFYRLSTNIIRPFIALDTMGIALMKPSNFGSAVTFGLEEIATVAPKTWWNINFNLSIFEQNISGIDESEEDEEISNSAFCFNTKIFNSFKIGESTTLHVIGNYNSPAGTPQGKQNAIYYVDLGFRYKFYKNKAALGLVVTDVFNIQKTGFTANENNFSYTRISKIDTRAIMFTFAYNFRANLKDELLDNKFKNE